MADPATRTASYNHYGQKIGSKGERTRAGIIAATVGLLESRGLRDVSVVEVAREAGVSPASFYVYFRGVPEVVLEALEHASQTSPELEDLLERDWTEDDASRTALRFVEAYADLWNAKGTIFRVRNLAAEEGDERFYAARMKAAQPMMARISAAIARAQARGRAPCELEPRACAGTILMMLERLSAVGPMTPEQDGLSYRSLKDAAAYTLLAVLGEVTTSPLLLQSSAGD